LLAAWTYLSVPKKIIASRDRKDGAAVQKDG
jgi:hypothetical protein